MKRVKIEKQKNRDFWLSAETSGVQKPIQTPPTQKNFLPLLANTFGSRALDLNGDNLYPHSPS